MPFLDLQLLKRIVRVLDCIRHLFGGNPVTGTLEHNLLKNEAMFIELFRTFLTFSFLRYGLQFEYHHVFR